MPSVSDIATLKNIAHLLPQWELRITFMLIFRDHGQGNSRENAVTKSETQISELRSCFFSQDSLKFHQGMLHENMARRQPSVSPFVNVYLYLVGNGAPPKARHMVSSEAQNKNISPICTPTSFCLPISTLMKADYFNLTLKKKKPQNSVPNLLSILFIQSIWSEEILPERITFTLGLLSKTSLGWIVSNMELNAINAYGKVHLHSHEIKKSFLL